MTETIKYRLAKAKDLDTIKDLLQRSGLPIADIEENNIGFIVAVNDTNELIGCIGLERHGSDGLLRSFAVDPAFRSKGIGQGLFERLLSMSGQYGITDVHLLTTTAEKFFKLSGFSVASRDEAPVSLKATSEFSSICPSSSAYMVMRDIQKHEVCFHTDTQIFQQDKENGSDYWAVRGKNSMLTYFEVPPDTKFPFHKHGSEQITYVLEGELCFEIENKTYCLGAGDTIIIPLNKSHRVWTESKHTKAIDAWSPVNEKFALLNKAEQAPQTIKQKIKL